MQTNIAEFFPDAVYMPAVAVVEPVVAPLRPANHLQRTANPLRPATLAAMIGQVRTRAFLRRVIDATLERGTELDHVLLVAPSGAGKSTIANVIANELEVDCYQLQAPVSHDTLLELRDVMVTGDVLFIDEVHQQAIQERRGKSSATQPEVLFSVMEDRTIITATGVLDFPTITVIAATTDEGMLPDPFINRFPLRPVLEAYDAKDLAQIAIANAEAFELELHVAAALIFANAARGVPRQINNFVRNAATLVEGGVIGHELAREVVTELNQTTLDGLNQDMQRTLVFLYERCKRKTPDGPAYQASISTLATAIGKSRDTKAIVLRVEPYLIAQGYLQVGHGGRKLTDRGIKRARNLTKGT